ncbi:7TM chemoreceptor [Cooperia oncophora]
MNSCDNVEMKNHLYMSVMHSLSIIALFMNLFAFYCIVYKSTRQMGAYKWYLLAYQASSTAFDTVYTGFIIPVIYFPEAMGYPGSWLAEALSITGHAGVLMVFLTAALLVGCILNLFNYRCHVKYPCLQSVIYGSPRFTVFTLNKGIRLAMTVIVLAVTATVITVLCIVLSFYFIRMSGHLSQKTKRMQRRFLIYLCIQVGGKYSLH